MAVQVDRGLIVLGVMVVQVTATGHAKQAAVST